MRTVRLMAPAKINWTLEVLGKREDGYHEVRTVLQTVNLCDTVVLSEGDALTLSVRGGTRGFRRQATKAPETNLAYRAAELLRERSGVRRGADVQLRKHIPIAAGLGGGSSDAAAVLRGLRALWELDLGHEELMAIAAELGSDVPFFLHGGTALASGRGETIEALPDVEQPALAITTRRQPIDAAKTARMYAAIERTQYTDGARSAALAARIRSGGAVRAADLCNAFEGALPAAAPDTARAMDQARALGIGEPHLCGSGPALYFLAQDFRMDRTDAEVYHNAFATVVALTSAQALTLTSSDG